MDIQKLAEEIIAGRRMTREDDLSFFEQVELERLADAANTIRKALCGNRVDLCTIINGRAGRCSEDCKFCAQSSHNHTGCEVYGILDKEEIVKDCKQREQDGVHGYSIVTAGKTVDGEELEALIDIYETLHKECKIRLCASHGFVSRDALKRLKEAGVMNYHANIETSKNYFSNICTTHTYEDKIREITYAKEAGLNVCSGGIIGMGESFADRIDMAIALAQLEVNSIPINVLIPVKGTPLGDQTPLTEDEIIRTVAMFRFLNPTAYIRMAAGRNYFKDGGRRLFAAGANATITGDMLTTIGNHTKQDVEMFQEMGFVFR